MSRIRSVHPGLWTDEAFVSVSPMARLLFVGIWTEADDLGCFEWKPVTLKMRVLPVDNADVGALMNDLHSANMVMRYTMNGREYGAVRNFCRYQRPKKPKSVHPITDEVRLFVGSAGEGSEPDEDEGGSGSSNQTPQPPAVPKKAELKAVQAGSVPQFPEKSSQMEDGGDNKKVSTVLRTDAKPSPDIRSWIWSEGLAAVRAMTGLSEDRARSLVGKFARNAKDNLANVARVIMEASDLRPIDPVGWMTKALASEAPRQPASAADMRAAMMNSGPAKTLDVYTRPTDVRVTYDA